MSVEARASSLFSRRHVSTSSTHQYIHIPSCCAYLRVGERGFCAFGVEVSTLRKIKGFYGCFLVKLRFAVMEFAAVKFRAILRLEVGVRYGCVTLPMTKTNFRIILTARKQTCIRANS